MRFRDDKAEALASLQPDIAVISECSRRDLEAFATEHSYNALWRDGSEPPSLETKGLGVVTRAKYGLALGRCHDPTHRLILPVEIRDAVEINLLAVWTKDDPRGKQHSHAAAICRALETYREFLSSATAVVAGDFNSNVIWDSTRTLNFAEADKRFSALGLTSAYHSFYGERHGRETRATHYFWKKRDRTFHIDYCYVPSAWLDLVSNVELGTFETWVSMSDHVPVVVDVTPEDRVDP